MRMYKVALEHKQHGLNWASRIIAARTCAEAMRKVLTIEKGQNTRIESVELLCCEDY